MPTPLCTMEGWRQPPVLAARSWPCLLLLLLFLWFLVVRSPGSLMHGAGAGTFLNPNRM